MTDYIPNGNGNGEEKQPNSRESDSFDYIDVKAVEEINREFSSLPEVKRVSILEERIIKKSDPTKL